MLDKLIVYSLLIASICERQANAITLPYVAPPPDVLSAEGVTIQPFPLLAAPANGASISQEGWTVTVDSFQPGNEGPLAIDGNPDTFWHTEWTPVQAPLPHTITIDMKQVYNVDGFTYLPRQDGNFNGNIGQHQIFTSVDGITFTMVAFGTFYDDATLKTSSWEPLQAQYVRIVALSEAGNRGPWTSAAEINVYQTAPINGVAISQAGWTAAVDSFQPGNEGPLAIDGNSNTFWHTEWTPVQAPFPHTITIDMKQAYNVNGFTYLPRQDGNSNGNIGSYQVSTSTDGTTFTLVTSGSFVDDSTLKSVSWTANSARYLQLKTLSEAGNRGPWTSAAEINIYQAVPPNGVAISQAGWTAAVDSFQPGNEGPLAIDGNSNTFWHTEWTPVQAPFPHTITIDMKQTYNVNGFTYLPRQDGNFNGNIGSYQISTSTDGTTFTLVTSGSFVDDHTLKSVSWTAKSARYLQLVALSEAGNRGPWTSAAEIDIYQIGTPITPTGLGKWGPTINFPLVPVAAALEPNGNVLTWSAYAYDTFTGGNGANTLTSTYNPSSGVVSERLVTNINHDMFCPGISLDFNGRPVVTGGNNAPQTSTYNPVSNAWITGPKMNIPRGYQSSATCSDGRIFTIGGSWSGGQGGKNGEIYSPSANTWTLLPGCPVSPMLTADVQGVYRADNHGWLFGWKSGYVFQAGPSIAMNWYSTSGSGGQSAAGSRASDSDAMAGNAVMYDAVNGKILGLGGSPNYQGSQATSNANIITIGPPGANPSVTTVESMANSRIFANSVVLPDGKVFVTGGQTIGAPFSDANAVFTPEMWDPATNTFKSMLPNSIPRNYHSVALLLPDATVFSGGGGLCGTCSTNHFDAQIYTPQYLLTSTGAPASRPSITSLPTTASAGSQVTVKTDQSISTMSLIRMGSATHTVDTDQRRIALTFTTSGTNTYQFTIPSDRGVALPGYWMLFVLNSAGVPSKAGIIKVT